MKAARIHNFGGPLFSWEPNCHCGNFRTTHGLHRGLQKTVVCAIRVVHVSQAFTLKN